MKRLYILLALAVPVAVFAQQDKNKEAEQIIITKKGNVNEKLNIVVDGDNITVNGKPVDEDKITVTRRKIKDIDVFTDSPLAFGRQGNTFSIPMQGFAASPNKAMLGVATQKADKGVEVMNVSKESGAEKAGLKEGDIIIEVDKKKIETPDELSALMKDKEVGDKVTVVYLRNKKQYTAVAELTPWKNYDSNMDINQFLGNMPRNFNIEELGSFGTPGRNPNEVIVRGYGTRNTPKLGVKIQDLETAKGVKVLEVQSGSDAEKAGLREGDVITEVDGKTVQGTETISNALRQKNEQKSMKLKVERDGKSREIDLKFSKKIKTADL
ncbi:MAG: PDZ domain-containing protein [Niabella sp.]